MALSKSNHRSSQSKHILVGSFHQRRELLKRGALAGTLSLGVGRNPINASALVDLTPVGKQDLPPKSSTPELDATREAKKIAFDRIGDGDRILLISGFPQTRLSWNRMVTLSFSQIPMCTRRPAEFWRARAAAAGCRSNSQCLPSRGRNPGRLI